MSGNPNANRETGRVARKRAAARDEIVAAAWELVREHGLAALSLRDLGERVGMRAQSLYSYFPSKHAIYDAMFRQGYEQFLVEAAGAETDEQPDDWRGVALAGSLAYFDFCTTDPARYQLLFQRTVPGFAPSADSMAVAFEAYTRTVGQLQHYGVTDQAGLDLWTAVMTGLVDQQISNDPGGTRWRDLVPAAVEMLLAGKEPHTGAARPAKKKRSRS